MTLATMAKALKEEYELRQENQKQLDAALEFAANAEKRIEELENQRDALLEITWLDMLGDPTESIEEWREEFSKGWERKVLQGKLNP